MSDEQTNEDFGKNPDGDPADESRLDHDWLEGYEPSSDGDGGDPVEPYPVQEKPEIADDEPSAEPEMAPETDGVSEPVKEPKDRKTASERLAQWRSGAAGDGEALSRPGALDWKFYVVLSVAALIGAVTLSVTNGTYAEDANFWQKLGPAALESLRVLLRAPVHLSIGMLAFAMTAWAVGVRAGRGDLAAARIGLAVSLVIMALQLKWAFPGQRVVVYLIALGLYFMTVWLSFRCPPRVVGTLMALHAGLFATIAGLGWLIVWIGL